MKQQLVGMTLAMSIGLSASAWAGPSAASPQRIMFPAKIPALSQWMQLPEETPTPPNIPHDLAYLALAEGVLDTPETAHDYRMLAAAKPTTSAAKKPVAKTGAKPVAGSAALRQGVAQYNRGFIAKAIPLFEQAARQEPQNEMAFLWLARAHQKQGTPADQGKSKAAFQKVLNINPNNVEALSNLGEMWSWDPAMRGEAIQLLKRAYELKPGDAAISKKLAEALFWQGNAMDALRYAAPIANQYRTDRKWMASYAQMLSLTGHAEEALQIYNTVLKDDTQRSVTLRLDQARALLKSGQKQKAQAAFQEISQSVAGSAMAKNESFIQSMSSLAFDLDLHAESLKWDQALPASAQRQKDVQLRQARALAKVFRVPEAIDRFNRLYDAGLLSVDEKLEYAEYLRLLHLAPEALPNPNLVENLYREVAAEAPNNADVALRLARYYAEEEGRFEDTVAAYQQALSNPRLSSSASVKKELMDYLKSDKTQPARVEELFQQMMAAEPGDVQTKAGYAEYLSWQNDRRPEALRMYVELGQADPSNQELWQGRIVEVLKWHQPTTALIPLYQDIVNLYPQEKAIWATVARAYRNDKNYYAEAVETYSTLIKRYPDDGTLKREWLGLLLSNASQRSANIRMLKKMVADDPSDLDVLATYGKLLSYDHKYGPAMDAFEKALSQNPNHRDSLIGKGYVILWSGKKLEAKGFFQDLRKQYPDDVDIAIGLAQTEKLIGRYDEAMKIIQEIKPLMDSQQSHRLPESSSAFDVTPDFLPVASLKINPQPYQQQPIYDFSIVPVKPATEFEEFESEPVSSDVELAMAPEAQFEVQIEELPTTDSLAGNSETATLQAEIEALSEAVNSLKALQQSSRVQLDQLDKTIRSTRDALPYEMSLQEPDASSGGNYGRFQAGAGMSGSTASASGGSGRSVGQDGMRPAYGAYAALDYDTNPLLSGVGRLRNDELFDLERGLTNDLRPMIRGGFSFSRQDGEATTTRISSWGFPNQVSMSLTPQIRVRGGIRPTRYFLPDGVSPSSTLGLEYGVGSTIKYWDRLTLDGDIAITHFTQSRSENLTFNAQARYDFNDSISAKVGFSRLPQYNSLLAVAGQMPNRGAFRGDLVGQARENSIYAELNTNPFSQNWDWNLGYAWAFIDGSKVANNTKNQAFTSLGYTWHYSANHRLRVGYEFLYFGYGKNATNGFFDTTANGFNDPVVSLRPVTAANSGYVFGGYYSPHMFIMNAGRLDFRGSLFNKFLEYKLGGSLGAQTVRLGHGIKESANKTSLSSAFDANVILNFTDWLAAYGDVDFLDAGGQFNRWRFGGGLIVRPHIDALSPVFAPRSMSRVPTQ